MANSVLYNESGEERIVLPNTKEWKELIHQGWTTWKKPSSKKAGRPKKPPQLDSIE
mgnify:CR=1 FL=1